MAPSANAIHFSINEHDYSLSSSEKYAIDWYSRPFTDSVGRVSRPAS
jgi:hypothetical protein